jgi:monovalent cation:H+ antiporter, CPA1 family
MGLTLERVEALLLIAVVVGIAARRFKLPYTVGLVVAGIALAFVPAFAGIELTGNLIFSALLPPLIFEAAIQIPWRELRRDLPVTALFATVGVVLAGGVTAAGLHFGFGWPWIGSIAAGALLSATDPVSVIATFKNAKVDERLKHLVETESLLNDGTAAVLFALVVAVAGGASVTAAGAFGSFCLTVGGGILVGCIVAGLVLLLAGRTDEHAFEIALTTVGAYSSFWLAEHFGLSGVLATMACGVVIGNWGSAGALGDIGRETVIDFWEFAAFVANSLVFLLMGSELARQKFGGVWIAVAAIVGLSILSRAAAVYGCSLAFARSRLKIPVKHQHVLFWGGLRGALALALAFGLPKNIEHYGVIQTGVFGVVAFSVLVQGLTMTPLMKRLGVLQGSG